MDCLVPTENAGSEARVRTKGLFLRRDLMSKARFSKSLPIRRHGDGFNKITRDFPALCEDQPVAYLTMHALLFDHTPSSMRFQTIIRKPGLWGRSVHRFGTTVSKTIAHSRRTLGQFFNAPSVNEIVFTRMQPIASIKSLRDCLEKGDVVLTTDREHNSNLVPWLNWKKNRNRPSSRDFE